MSPCADEAVALGSTEENANNRFKKCDTGMRGKKQHTFLSEGAEMKEFKGKRDVAILTSQKSAVKMMTCGL